MSEGGGWLLYEGDNTGQLFQNGSPIGSPGVMSYTGDLAWNCRLVAAVREYDDNPPSNYLVRVSRGNGHQSVIGATMQMTTELAFVGLAYDQLGQLWGSSSSSDHPFAPINDQTGSVGTPIMKTPFILVDLASAPCRSCDQQPDLGDAPDSTNHAPNTPMTAYQPTGQQALFPTVYDPETGYPSGPKHWLPVPDDVWLGLDVSGEWDADLLPDEDLIVNIDPPQDQPDQDGYDDGVQFSLSLPHCQQTQFGFLVTAAIQHDERYINVWFDFNRDGDWQDTLTCVDPGRGTIQVPEWAVQDYTFTSPSPGQYLLTTPLFDAYNPNDPNEIRLDADHIERHSSG